MSDIETETTFSRERFKKAFFDLKPELDAMSNVPAKVSLDLGACSNVGFMLLQAVERPEVKTLLDMLAAEHLDPIYRHQLELTPWALLYVKTKLQSARLKHTPSALPRAMIAEAKEIASRQKKLAAYHFENQEDLYELKDIRKGKSYKDRAYDLIRLSRLLETNRDLVSQDTRNFREEDLQRGPELAAEILQRLGGPEPYEWKMYGRRLFGMFRTAYGEVQRAATFVMRNTPFKDDFPPLYTAVRKAPTKRKKTDDGQEAKGQKDSGNGKAVKGKKKTGAKPQAAQTPAANAETKAAPAKGKAAGVSAPSANVGPKTASAKDKDARTKAPSANAESKTAPAKDKDARAESKPSAPATPSAPAAVNASLKD